MKRETAESCEAQDAGWDRLVLQAARDAEGREVAETSQDRLEDKLAAQAREQGRREEAIRREEQKKARRQKIIVGVIAGTAGAAAGGGMVLLLR